MTTPLTADDFVMKYDADHDFPFIENEDATIMAWGHDNPDALLDAIFAYDQLCDPKFAERGALGDLSPRWAVRDEDVNEETNEDGWWISWKTPAGVVTESTPGAFPVTIWTR